MTWLYWLLLLGVVSLLSMAIGFVLGADKERQRLKRTAADERMLAELAATLRPHYPELADLISPTP